MISYVILQDQQPYSVILMEFVPPVN